jgi:hypothetical protein
VPLYNKLGNEEKSKHITLTQQASKLVLAQQHFCTAQAAAAAAAAEASKRHNTI